MPKLMEMSYSSHPAAKDNSRSVAVFFYALVGVVIFCILFFISYVPSYAQEGLTFTVTPPLFQLNLNPGESWSSTIRVVNGNSYDITIYTDPVSFEPDGESGRPKFDLKSTAPGSDTLKTDLASWVETPTDSFVLKSEQTVEVPLTIHVPSDAAPGGHYAAVLIGNKPPVTKLEGGTVGVASSIASLILLTVSGEVVEQGRIRDFVTEKSLYETPEARFSLRFENQGNVHLQPQGNVTIYNMFGKKRGQVPVNLGGHFGNVLPGSIRKFSFSWKADSGRWDIGRYKAEATLGYGKDAKQFAKSTVYFYVLPIMPLIQIAGVFLIFIAFLFWGIRAYIRRALSLDVASRAPQGVVQAAVAEKGGTETPTAKQPQLELRTLARPIQAGLVDLRKAAQSSTKPRTNKDHLVQQNNTQDVVPQGVVGFIAKYKFFILFIIVIAVAWFMASALLSDVLTYERTYKVEVDKTE